jgi:hypothetical protein
MLFRATDEEAKSGHLGPSQTPHDLRFESVLGSKADLDRTTNATVICPSGSFPETLSSPFAKNISLRRWVEAALVIPIVPHPHEGRFAIVTNVGRGMRWTL